MDENSETANAESLIQKNICLEIWRGELTSAKDILSKGVTIESIKQLFIDARWLMDTSTEKSKELFHLLEPACKASCSYCCYGRVGVIAPEVIVLSNQFRKSYSSDYLTNLLKKIELCASQVRGLSSRQRVAQHIACPLLSENGECSIYKVRPIRCRGWNAFDPIQCRSYWFAASETKIPDGIAIYDNIGRYILSAIIEALRESRIKADQLEFITALEIALNDSSVEDRWLNGEDVFHNAIIIDSSH
jgi:Fe-S-cluster containining protein